MLLALFAAAVAAPRPELFRGAPLPEAEQIFQVEVQRLSAEALTPFFGSADPAVRALATRAAGRLHAGAALLAGPAADSTALVRLEAAIALGAESPAAGAAPSPADMGCAEVVRARLAEERDPAVRRALLVALGRVGQGADLPTLTAALGSPESSAAAEAIGRMGFRRVQGVSTDTVVIALLDTLRLPIGDTRRFAAWGLARSTLSGLSPAVIARLQSAALNDPDARVRAWLVRAAAQVGQVSGLLATAAADPAAEVRVAAVRAMAKHGCVASSVDSALADPVGVVREEAIAAAADCEGVQGAPLLALLDAGSPAQRAAALRALVARKELPHPLADYQEDSFPLPVRLAAVEEVTDRGRQLRIALRHEDARLRSAAAGALVGGDEPPRAGELGDLLAASDIVVAQAAAEAAIEHPDPVLEKPLLQVLGRRDLTPACAKSAVKALDALYATGRLPRPNPDAVRPVRKWLSEPGLAEEAKRLAPLLGIDPPGIRHPDRALPSLHDVLEVRSARVFTERGEVRIELLPEVAPLTVWNFATLAERGYFDGLSFHRVVPDFVVQTGDPRGDGWGDPGYEIPDELSAEPYRKGTVGMALSGPDTGGSQWFITLSPHPHLDFGYTVFGRVTLGQRAAEAIGVGDHIVRVEIERVRGGGN